jgi:hypothetical protein
LFPIRCLTRGKNLRFPWPSTSLRRLVRPTATVSDGGTSTAVVAETAAAAAAASASVLAVVAVAAAAVAAAAAVVGSSTAAGAAGGSSALTVSPSMVDMLMIAGLKLCVSE